MYGGLCQHTLVVLYISHISYLYITEASSIILVGVVLYLLYTQTENTQTEISLNYRLKNSYVIQGM